VDLGHRLNHVKILVYFILFPHLLFLFYEFFHSIRTFRLTPMWSYEFFFFPSILFSCSLGSIFLQISLHRSYIIYGQIKKNKINKIKNSTMVSVTFASSGDQFHLAFTGNPTTNHYHTASCHRQFRVSLLTT
jgi:hypothetical protein